MSEVINIFIAYAREDKSYLDELRKHLKPFDRRNLIKIWYDGEIIPGTRWEDEIKHALHTAEIILLLVSANSLSSDYFYEKEVSDALSRHHKNETIVVPIILGYCAWDMTELSNLQVLPTDGVPIDEWEPKSKGYAIIVRSLKKSIELAREKKVDSSQKDNSEKDVGEDKMPSQIVILEKKETLNKFAWGKGASQLFYFLLATFSKVRKVKFSKESPNFLYLISLSFLFFLILCPLTIYQMVYDEVYGLSLSLSIILGAIAFFYAIKVGKKASFASIIPVLFFLFLIISDMGWIDIPNDFMLYYTFSFIVVMFILSYSYIKSCLIKIINKINPQ